MKKSLLSLLLLTNLSVISDMVPTKSDADAASQEFPECEVCEEAASFLDEFIDDTDEAPEIELPEASPVKELILKIGCEILAKYYLLEQFFKDKYLSTKKMLSRIKRRKVRFREISTSNSTQ